MKTRCFLCGKTVQEIAKEELQEVTDTKRLSICLDTEISFPYYLCETCKDFLCIVIPQILKKSS